MNVEALPRLLLRRRVAKPHVTLSTNKQSTIIFQILFYKKISRDRLVVRTLRSLKKIINAQNLCPFQASSCHRTATTAAAAMGLTSNDSAAADDESAATSCCCCCDDRRCCPAVSATLPPTCCERQSACPPRATRNSESHTRQRARRRHRSPGCRCASSPADVCDSSTPACGYGLSRSRKNLSLVLPIKIRTCMIIIDKI